MLPERPRRGNEPGPPQMRYAQVDQLDRSAWDLEGGMAALRQSQAGQQGKQEAGTHAQHPRRGGCERKSSVRGTGHGL